MEHKVHLLTQPMYLQARGHAKPAFLSHPLPAHRWAEPKPRWVEKRVLDRRKDASRPLERGPGRALVNDAGLPHELWR